MKRKKLRSIRRDPLNVRVTDNLSNRFHCVNLVPKMQPPMMLILRTLVSAFLFPIGSLNRNNDSHVSAEYISCCAREF